MGTGEAELPARGLRVQGEEMLQAEEVAAMVRLHELGWGAKRLSKEFGCARNTVRRYLRAGGAAPSASPSARRRSTVWRLAARAVLPPRRERRRRSPGAGERAWDQDLPALGGEAGPGLAARAEGREACHGALRDPARPAIADRLRRGPGLDRRGAGPGASVRRHARLLASHAHPPLASRASAGLVRGAGGELPSIRGRAGGGPVRQCPRLGRAP